MAGRAWIVTGTVTVTLVLLAGCSSPDPVCESLEGLQEAPDAATIAALTAEIADTQQAWEALKAAAPDRELG